MSRTGNSHEKLSLTKKRRTVPDFLMARTRGEKLAMLTAYDYTMARLVDAAGVDGILVGDSLGMVIQGQPNSLSVTLEEMLYHSRMVTRGVERALVVVDLPFMSFQISPQQALENAGRLVKEGGAHAVKLEGGVRSAKAIEAITSADIPVMGHIGLTPHSVLRFGGFRVQLVEDTLLEDAVAVEQAGAFSFVVECVPSGLAQKITKAVRIPTIGIGAGPDCDGQILVGHDIFNLGGELRPRFVKQYADLGAMIAKATREFCEDVRKGTFPEKSHTYK